MGRAFRIQLGGSGGPFFGNPIDIRQMGALTFWMSNPATATVEIETASVAKPDADADWVSLGTVATATAKVAIPDDATFFRVTLTLGVGTAIKAGLVGRAGSRSI